MSSSLRVSGAGVLPLLLSVAVSLIGAPLAAAQAQPAAASPAPIQAMPQVRQVTGFVSSYEILRTARAAGFAPMGVPLRNGTIYVLRATDFRGILMRVVLDARTGAIRDVTRIVPADSGAYGMMSPYGPPPYGPPPYAPPPYEPPPAYGPAAYGPPPYGEPASYGDVPQDLAPDASRPPFRLAAPAASPPRTMRTPAPAHAIVPPLPRPRPAMLASRNVPQTGKAQGPDQHAISQPGSLPSPGPGGVARTAPAPANPPSKTPPVAPFND